MEWSKKNLIVFTFNHKKKKMKSNLLLLIKNT